MDEFCEFKVIFYKLTMTDDNLMNSTDKQLLSLLRSNARISTSELARRLDLSRTTVQSRIQRLEQQGIIKGYTLKFGEDYQQRLVRSHVQIKLVQKLTNRTCIELENIPQVTALYAISGDYDVIAVLETESTQELSQLLDDIGYLKGVERTNSSLILDTKFSR